MSRIVTYSTNILIHVVVQWKVDSCGSCHGKAQAFCDAQNMPTLVCTFSPFLTILSQRLPGSQDLVYWGE